MHLLALIFVTLLVITLGSWDLLSSRVGSLPTVAMSLLLAAAAVASAWFGYWEGRQGRPRPEQRRLKRRRPQNERLPPPTMPAPPADWRARRRQQHRQSQQ